MAQDGVQDDDGTFIRPTLDEIINRKKDKAVDVFGADVDLSQGSPIKQIIDTTAHEHDHVWQLMEDVYYSAYYGEAHGVQLDKLMGIASISRKPRRGATGVVNFTTLSSNSEDVTIREGVRVATLKTEDRPSIPFKTTEAVTLPAGASSVNGVPIRACEPWETDLDPEWLGEETNIAAGTIKKFETPVRGVDEVTNPYPTGEASREQGYSFIHGRDRETDREFRNRFENQFGGEAWATLDSLRSNLLDHDQIRNVGMEENVTMNDNAGSSGGLPPKSFRATILGDAPPADVAQILFDRRPAGMQSWGLQSATAYDSDGNERTELWDWAGETYVYVDANITHDDSYPQDGNLRVQNAIIEEIGGTTINGDEFMGTGMGDDVVYDLVHSACMNVPGVWRADVDMGIVESELSSTDVVVNKGFTAITDYEDVNIFSTKQSRE